MGRLWNKLTGRIDDSAGRAEREAAMRYRQELSYLDRVVAKLQVKLDSATRRQSQLYYWLLQIDDGVKYNHWFEDNNMIFEKNFRRHETDRFDL